VAIKETFTWFHKHKNALSTLSYAGHVEKSAYATPYLAKKNKATTKSKLSHKLSCGISKTETLT
jgi:hypothetical protein